MRHTHEACRLRTWGMQSEPETTMSPATTAAQPELLSPEAANRPLPQDDAGQQHQHRQHRSHSHLHSHSQFQSQPHHHHPSSPYETAQRSGTPSNPWPAGFIPYPLPGQSTSSTSKPGSRPVRDHRRAQSTPSPAPNSNSNRNPNPDPGRSQNGHVRTRTQSASTSMGRADGIYEAAPLPPGVMYPAPPVRPHTSHRRYRDSDEDRDWVRVRESDRDDRDRDRERARNVVRDRDRGVERERVRDRDKERERERRRDLGRDYDGEGERERNRDRVRVRVQDPEDAELDEELTRSPAPLQRPISLFDSDEA
jgi:hypothetical protein